MNNDLPIVCTLTEEELVQRRTTLLDSMPRDALSVQSLPDGYVYTFSASSEMLAKIVNLVDLERRCCRFLTFTIVVEPRQNVRLEITGPPEARNVIAAYFGKTIP